MLISQNLRWFTNVVWVEEGCFIDCLVEIGESTSRFNHEWMLVQTLEQLKLFPFDEIKNLRVPFKVIGRAIRKSVPL